MAYLLDTNIVIAAIKDNTNVVAKLETLTPETLTLSPIEFCELKFGIAKCQRPRRQPRSTRQRGRPTTRDSV